MNYRNPGCPERIAAAIRESGMTQREIARRMGNVSDVSISHYANRWRLPSPGRLATLARVLDVDVRSLLRDPDEFA